MLRPLSALLLFYSVIESFAGGAISVCDDSSLRAALAGGGSVSFSVSGIVALTNTLAITNDTIIDGAGQDVSISGEGSVRIFHVWPGASLTLLNVSMINGQTNEGAAIYNEGGSVLASNCLFTGNVALGIPGIHGYGTNAASAGTPGYGGAIYSRGSLILLNSTFLTNKAAGGEGGSVISIGYQSYGSAGEGAPGKGGAIYSISPLELTNCTFLQNRAEGGNGGSSADANVAAPSQGAEGSGGAIYSGANLNASNTHFSLNSCKSGDGGTGGEAGWGGIPADSNGGALVCFAGDVSLVDCTFNGNSAEGGYNENARNNRFRGAGRGGAIYNIRSKVTILNCQLKTNSISGSPVTGGGFHNGWGPVTISNSSFIGNTTAADRMTSYYGSDGAPASGGGIFTSWGDMLITHSTVASNEIRGGRSTFFPYQVSDGGAASGAGLCAVGSSSYRPDISGSIRLNHCTFAGNTATGGIAESDYGGRGGNAYGAGAFFSLPAQVLNCTFAGNTAQGGGVRTGDAANGGNAFGGGLYAAEEPVSLTNCTLAENRALAGLGWAYHWDGSSCGGNVASIGGSVRMLNTILSGGTSTNAFGYLGDQGHNISSDASYGFSTPGRGSFNNLNPKLLPLANNGGPTPTMALLPDSPAVDSGATAADVSSDQRGVPRPYGTAPDIGAYEWNATSFYKDFSLSAVRNNNRMTMPIKGPGTTIFRVQRSTDLLNWSDICTNTSGTRGMIIIEDTQLPGASGFYRVVSP